MEDYGIKDKRLKEFCLWYSSHFNKRDTFTAGMSISCSGHFSTTAKVAMKLLKRCNELGYITMKRESIKINVGI